MKYFWALTLLIILAACGSESTKKESISSPVSSSKKGKEPVRQEVKTSPDELKAKSWELINYVYNGEAIRLEKNSTVSLNFKGDRISGNAGCNDFNGKYTAGEDGSIAIETLGVTKKMCERLMDQEQKILELLQGAGSFSSTNIFMEIKSEKGRLFFKPV